MKTIEEAKKFIFDFIEWQHKILRGVWDISLSDEEHRDNYKYFKETFYHNPTVIEFNSSSLMRSSFDGIKPESITKMFNSTIQPKIFIIREYHNPKLGKGLEIDNNIIFNCIVGDNSTPNDISFYATNYSFAEVNGKLKMVCERTEEVGKYSNGIIKWGVMEGDIYDTEDITIINDGRLMNTMRFEAPDFQESLDDYKIG